jgi:hypothetical protein
LRHIAAQKADGASQKEANTRAVWDRVDAMIANKALHVQPGREAGGL